MLPLHLLLLLFLAKSGESGLEMARLKHGDGFRTSSTLAWAPHIKDSEVTSFGGWDDFTDDHVAHDAVAVAMREPLQFWCRGQLHSILIPGATSNSTCLIPFLNNVHVLEDYDVLVSIKGATRFKTVFWDKYSLPPDNAIASPALYLAVVHGKNKTVQPGYLMQQKRSAYVLDGHYIKETDSAEILIEDEPVRYGLVNIQFDLAREVIVSEEVEVASATLINPNAVRQTITQNTNYFHTRKIYWGQHRGTIIGIESLIYPPGEVPIKLIWGMENDLTSTREVTISRELEPGASVHVKLIGTFVTREVPYEAELTSVFGDDSQTSRNVNSLHIYKHLVKIVAHYGNSYYFSSNTSVPGSSSFSRVMYSSTTARTVAPTENPRISSPDTNEFLQDNEITDIDASASETHEYFIGNETQQNTTLPETLAGTPEGITYSISKAPKTNTSVPTVGVILCFAYLLQKIFSQS